MESIPGRPLLVDRLNEPATVEMLHRLLDHAELFDRALQSFGELPSLLAIAVDFFDEMAKRSSEQGIRLEERAASLLRLATLLTAPEAMRAIESLVARLPQIAESSVILSELPNLVAIATDVFDEWVDSLRKDGIQLEDSVRRGLRAALYLGGQIREEELDRIGYLLKSDVMSQNAVEAVGLAGSALSSCREGSCEHRVPPRTGVFGFLKAMRDPHTQQALSFALQFAKCFGRSLCDDREQSPSK